MISARQRLSIIIILLKHFALEVLVSIYVHVHTKWSPPKTNQIAITTRMWHYVSRCYLCTQCLISTWLKLLTLVLSIKTKTNKPLRSSTLFHWTIRTNCARSRFSLLDQTEAIKSHAVSCVLWSHAQKVISFCKHRFTPQLCTRSKSMILLPI